jgi:hypothetical protein
MYVLVTEGWVDLQFSYILNECHHKICYFPLKKGKYLNVFGQSPKTRKTKIAQAELHWYQKIKNFACSLKNIKFLGEKCTYEIYLKITGKLTEKMGKGPNFFSCLFKIAFSGAF